MGSHGTAPARRGCSDSALCHTRSLLGCLLPEFRGHQPKISAHPCQQAVSPFNQQNMRHRKGYRKSPKQMGQNITGATEVCDICLGQTERFLEASVFVAHSCPTLCDPVDCSLPGSSVHGILQARTLEWAAIPSSRGFS